MINCLVVDDEPIARQGMLEHIRQIDFLHAAASCKSAVEAMTVLQQKKIDLIFLDIQMPRMTGIEFLKNHTPLPPVIFTTAYPEYAIESYELDILDYLLKPVSFSRFQKAAIKARDYIKRTAAPPHTGTVEYFFIKCNQKIEKINTGDIVYIEGLSNYVLIHTTQKKYITYLTFKGIEEELGDADFIRIHKSYLVAVSAIQSVTNQEVILENISLPLSKSYKPKVMEQVEKRLFKR